MFSIALFRRTICVPEDQVRSLSRDTASRESLAGESLAELTYEDWVFFQCVQRQIYTDWANHYLERAGHKRLVRDLQKDITDGVLLATIIEVVANEKIQDINPKPKSQSQMIENIEACLSFLAAKGVNIQGLSPQEIRDGNLKAILGLFFSLSRYKQQLQQQQRSQGATRSQAQTADQPQSKQEEVWLPAPKASSRSASNLNRRSLSAADKNRIQRNSQGSTVSTTSSEGPPVANGGSSIPQLSSKSSRVPSSVKSDKSDSSKSGAKTTSKTTTTKSVSKSASKSSVAKSPGSDKSADSTLSRTGKNSMLDKFRFFGGSNSKSASKSGPTGTTSKSSSSSSVSTTSGATASEPTQANPKSGIKDAAKRRFGKALSKSNTKDATSNSKTASTTAVKKTAKSRTDAKATAAKGKDAKSTKATPEKGADLKGKASAVKHTTDENGTIETNTGVKLKKSSSRIASFIPKGTLRNTASIHQLAPKADSSSHDTSSSSNIPVAGSKMPGKAISFGLGRKTTNSEKDKGAVYENWSAQGRTQLDSAKTGAKLFEAGRQASNDNLLSESKRSASGSINFSPPHGHVNTATVAPFSHIATSLPNSDSNVSSNSNNSHSDQSKSTSSSKDSVVYRPSADEVSESEAEVSAKRAAKDIANLRQNLEDTILSLRSSQINRSTLETTFGSDDVFTQSHPRTSMETVFSESGARTLNRTPGHYSSLRSVSLASNVMPVQGVRVQAGEGFASPLMQPRLLNYPYQTGSLRRTISSRSTMVQGDIPESSEEASLDLDLSGGYVSDGDVLSKNLRSDDIASGYMSEGGASLYSRRMQAKFADGMAAVRECMKRSQVQLLDTDSMDDSSSISSGISDTIGEISTDDISSMAETPISAKKVGNGPTYDFPAGQTPKDTVDGKKKKQKEPDSEKSSAKGGSNSNIWRKYSPSEREAQKSLSSKPAGTTGAVKEGSKWQRGKSDMTDSTRKSENSAAIKNSASVSGSLAGRSPWRKDARSDTQSPTPSVKSNASSSASSPKSQRGRLARQDDRGKNSPKGQRSVKKSSDPTPSQIAAQKAQESKAAAAKAAGTSSFGFRRQATGSTNSMRGAPTKTTGRATMVQPKQGSEAATPQDDTAKPSMHLRAGIPRPGRSTGPAGSTRSMNRLSGSSTASTDSRVSSMAPSVGNTAQKADHPSSASEKTDTTPVGDPRAAMSDSEVKDKAKSKHPDISSPTLKRIFGIRGSNSKQQPVTTAQNMKNTTIISNPHATFESQAKAKRDSPVHQEKQQKDANAPSSSANDTEGMCTATYIPGVPGFRNDHYRSSSSVTSQHSNASSPWAQYGGGKVGSMGSMSHGGSHESIDSTTSASSHSRGIHRFSRDGLNVSQGGIPLGRSNSLRSTVSEQCYVTNPHQRFMNEETSAWLRSNSYSNVVPETSEPYVAETPTSPMSTASAGSSRFTYPLTAVDPATMTNSPSSMSMSRLSTVSSPGYAGPYPGVGPQGRLRDGQSCISLDERRRRKNSDADEMHGSNLSLVSSSSSIYSTPEDKKEQEIGTVRGPYMIRKLRRELDQSQEKVATLSTQLTTNAHVVAAFEQSLSNMTERLKGLTVTAEQKDAELMELRRTIEQLKQQSQQQQLSNTSPGHPWRTFGDGLHGPNLRMTRLPSTDSVSSMNSVTSVSSAGSGAESEPGGRKKKKKSWEDLGRLSGLRSSFKAFSRKKNRMQSQSDVEDSLTTPESIPGSPRASLSSLNSSMGMNPMKGSSSTSALPGSLGKAVSSTSIHINPMVKVFSSPAIYDGDEESVDVLKSQLREKDMKLTDIRLEALSSAHQLDQLKETMNKMKGEMNALRAENDRLQQQVLTRSSCSDMSTSSQHFSDPTLNLDPISSSLDLLLDVGSGESGRKVIVTVALPTIGAPEKSEYYGIQRHRQTLRHNKGGKAQQIIIGALSVSGKTKWDMLDNVVHRLFKEYLLRIDPVSNLGLTSDSIRNYTIGEIIRSKESELPELLPCGYLVGDNNSIAINLKDIKENSSDTFAFESLIPKAVLQRYINLLAEQKRVIMCGPSGTGKTFLAQKLAEFMVQRSGEEVTDSTVVVFNVDHKSCKDSDERGRECAHSHRVATSQELRQYLCNMADQCESGKMQAPLAIVLDNLHNVGSLGEVFNGFLGCRSVKSPYIIGTMNQANCSSTNLQLHHNFRWILCANHMEPVKGFLGRYLRRKLVESEIKGSARNPELTKVVEWMPKAWQHLNKFLETHSSSDVTIGPRLFLSCPTDVSGSQVWFTDLWNYSIVPYLLEAVREGLQTYGRKASTWDDPALWVIENYPWTTPTSDLSSLIRLRAEDVGFDGYALGPQAGTKKEVTGSQSDVEGDPLMNMLMRLQEAANYSPQSCDSDSNSVSSGVNGHDDLLDSSIESTL
ncbi:neuron navigator 3-like isoform X2 [Branchiostoma floridae]|uniref:Neuron navigator 3-like isoform X2 n=1 Tax=Branchiostoma floridae TaxID=7739 RepID=A0A9J7KJL5_BRAFL|nr:neuron navigator 3-like isoform X2 [Branchiostoma floridae]